MPQSALATDPLSPWPGDTHPWITYIPLGPLLPCHSTLGVEPLDFQPKLCPAANLEEMLPDTVVGEDVLDRQQSCITSMKPSGARDHGLAWWEEGDLDGYREAAWCVGETWQYSLVLGGRVSWAAVGFPGGTND